MTSWLAGLALIAPAAAAAVPCAGPASDFDPAQPIAVTRPPVGPELASRRILLSVTAACARGAADAILRAGGVIEHRVDAVGYLRFRVAAFPLEQLPALPGIEAALLAPRPDEMFAVMAQILPALRQRSSAVSERAERPLPDRSALLRYDNPYTLAAGIGVERFMAANPSHDGRGVTIAVIDDGIDPSVPQLAEARSTDGRPVRKLVDFRTAVDPAVETRGGGWVDMRARIRATGVETLYEGQRLRLPAAGRFRIGALAEQSGAMPDYLGGDVDGDGNPAGSDQPFLILWRESDDRVWVDTNRDRDFSDETSLANFAEAGDYGFFRPARPVPTRPGPVAFAVQTDREHQAVAVLTGGLHSAMAASSAAGSGYFGGGAGGVAPGARLMAVSLGVSSWRTNSQSQATLYGSLEALLSVLADRRVDVVSYYPPTTWVSNDGRSVLERVVRRAVRHYRKPVLTAAYNSGPSLSMLAHSGDEAISIGAFTARETLAANTGIAIQEEGIVRTYSARGPADDGAAGPSLLAPNGFLAANAGHVVAPPGLSTIPGYVIGGGTSQATPTAAGAVALLIGAARRTGLPHDGPRIEAALLGSARWLEGYGAHEQGAGLIDVPAAFALLRRIDGPIARIEVAGPVVARGAGGEILRRSGRGLFEREGWRAGEAGTRRLTILRSTGPSAPQRYRVELRGNDGTFSAADEVQLARGRPMDFPVTIAPGGSGVHSALLRLLDPTSGAVVHQTLLTVVAAEPLAADAPALARDLELRFMHPRSMFVAVPDSIRSLVVRATMPRTRAELGLRPPWPRAPRSGACTETPAPGEQSLITCTVPDPAPGVWEIYADWPSELSPDGPYTPDGGRTLAVRVEAEVLERNRQAH